MSFAYFATVIFWKFSSLVTDVISAARCQIVTPVKRVKTVDPVLFSFGSDDFCLAFFKNTKLEFVYSEFPHFSIEKTFVSSSGRIKMPCFSLREFSSLTNVNFFIDRIFDDVDRELHDNTYSYES